MTAIDVRALSKLHGSDPVLLDVTFSVAPGTLVALTGSTASGKSTLLRLLAGTLSPSGGRIKLFDLDIRYARLEAQATLGFVPQGRAACSSMRAVDLLRNAGRARRLPAASLGARIEALVEHWALGEHLHARADLLEPAARARLNIALALLHAPRLLLLDDPLTGVPGPDARDILVRLQQLRPQVTTLLATAATEPATPCDRILHLDRGRLVSGGELPA